MNTLRILTTYLLGATSAAVAAPWVTETATEFFAAVDLDLNGSEDILIVDKASGVVRMGLQNGGNVVNWPPPKDSGIRNVEAAAVGAFGGGTEVALTTPMANRLSFVDAFSSAEHRYVFPSHFTGPGALAALGSSLAVGSEFEPSVDGAGLSIINGSGMAVSPSQVPLSSKLAQGHSIRLNSFGPESAAFLSNGHLMAWEVPTLVPQLQLNAAGFAPGSQWLADFFNPMENRPQVVHFVPGQPILSTQQVVPSGGGPAAFSLDAVVQFDLQLLIQSVVSIQNGSSRKLLALGGSTAKLFDFDGVSAPTLRQSWTAPPGEEFTAAAAISGGHFWLMSGLGGVSTRWQKMDFNGLVHTAVGSGQIPQVTNIANTGNHVFGFLVNPFLYPDAPLEAMATAGDWTTNAPFGFGTFNVTSEIDRGTSLGLGNAYSRSVSLPGWMGGMPTVNQLASDCSLFSFAGRETLGVPQLTLAPPPGNYASGINVALAFTNGATPTEIRYRRSPTAPWENYSEPILLSVSTELLVVGRTNQGNSPIVSAHYTIAAPNSTTPESFVDADNDCLDDAWELAFGQSNPAADPDGDGRTNLQEYIAGSDPLDAASFGNGATNLLAATDLAILHQDETHFRLQWQYPGDASCVSFRIWGSSDPASPNWIAILDPLIAQQGGHFSAVVSKPNLERYYYRIETVK